AAKKTPRSELPPHRHSANSFGLGTAVRKVSRGLLRRRTSLSERDASSARCPSRPAYATLSATALGSSDELALAPVVVSGLRRPDGRSSRPPARAGGSM